jgi:hypothetical protein
MIKIDEHQEILRPYLGGKKICAETAHDDPQKGVTNIITLKEL